MKPALVIGSAACLPDDLAALEALAGPAVPLDRFATFAANDGGVLWPGPLAHWFTLHPKELPERIARRRAAGYPDGFVTWSIGGDVDRVVPRDWRLDGASSGIMAAAVAAYLGHERIVLCGVPLDAQGYATTHPVHGDKVWPHWPTYAQTVPSLVKQHRWLRERIRSMSGFSAQLFGRPEATWLR